MASKITLKNNQQKELSIINRDNTGAKTIYGDQLVMSVDTIADMEAITTGVLDTSYDGTTCIVKADGGRNGTFVYSNAEVANDNQGTVFNGWVRQYSGTVNVQWFGANSVRTDNQIPIANAIASSNNVFIPSGTFITSAQIVIASEVHISGEDGSKLNGQDLSNGFAIGDNVNVRIENIDMINYLVCVASSVVMTSVDYVEIINCRLRLSVNAVHMEQSASSIERIVFKDNIVRDMSSHGVWITSGFNSLMVSGNTIYNIIGSGITIGAAIDGEIYKNINISNNKINNCSNTGILEAHAIIVTGGTRAVISGNTIHDIYNTDGTNAEGIYTKATYANISNNVLVDAGSWQGAIACKGFPSGTVGEADTHHLIISNNNISTKNRPTGTTGILAYSDDVLIEGNSLENLDRSGIYCDATDDLQDRVFIRGNMFKNISPEAIEFVGNPKAVYIENNSFETITNPNSEDNAAIKLTNIGADRICGYPFVVKNNYFGSIVPKAGFESSCLDMYLGVNGIRDVDFSGNYILAATNGVKAVDGTLIDGFRYLNNINNSAGLIDLVLNGEPSRYLIADVAIPFTTGFYDAVTGGNASSTTVTGFYTRSGNTITVNIPTINNIDTTGLIATNTLYIDLPAFAKTVTAGVALFDNINLAADSQVNPVIVTNTSRARFHSSGDSTLDKILSVDDVTTGVTDMYSLSITYIIA